MAEPGDQPKGELSRARVRVARVRFKHAPNITLIPVALQRMNDEDDSRCVRTLLWLLQKARRNEITYYVGAFGFYNHETKQSSNVTMGDVADSGYYTAIGALEEVKIALLKSLADNCPEYTDYPLMDD